MKIFIIIFFLHFIIGSGFGQVKNKGISKEFRSISVLNDSIRIFVPTYIRYPGIEYYSETKSFDTSLESYNQKESFSVYGYDFRQYEKNPDINIIKRVSGILRDEKKALINKSIIKVNNITVAFFKYKFTDLKKTKKIFGIITFFLPDSRRVDIKIYLLYSREKLKILDDMFNSFTLLNTRMGNTK